MKIKKLAVNKIGIVLVDLAPSDSDPYTHLREIGFILRRVRNQIDGVPAITAVQYTAVPAVLIELIQLIRLDRLLPPSPMRWFQTCRVRVGRCT